MLVIVLVGLGGALGSIARFAVSAWVQRRSHSGFPWGTLSVNASGTLVIGAVYGLFDGGAFASDALTFLSAGVLGGFTTFSTFSIENLKLLQNRRAGLFLVNALGQVIIGLAFVALGYWLGSVIV